MTPTRMLIWMALLMPMAAAAQTPPAKPEPAVQALAQMLSEAQQREASALIRAVTAERRADEADTKLAAQKANAKPAASP